MIGIAKKNSRHISMERVIANKNKGICTMCNKKIKSNNLRAREIDGLLLCGSACADKFLKEKKTWTPAGWDALCKIQALYIERQRAEIHDAKKELLISSCNSLLSDNI